VAGRGRIRNLSALGSRANQSDRASALGETRGQGDTSVLQEKSALEAAEASGKLDHVLLVVLTVGVFEGGLGVDGRHHG